MKKEEANHNDQNYDHDCDDDDNQCKMIIIIKMKDHLRLLMEGRPYEELHEFCDFTLQDQNEVVHHKSFSNSLRIFTHHMIHVNQ